MSSYASPPPPPALNRTPTPSAATHKRTKKASGAAPLAACSKKKKEEGQPQEAQLTWLQVMCERLTELLLKSYREGKQADGGFKEVALREAESAISAITSQLVSTAKIETKFEYYKRIWRT